MFRLLPPRMDCGTAAVSLTLILLSGATAAEYFVAPSGSDSNPGSSSAPFRTIYRAIAVAQGGDTITVGPGTYSTTVPNALSDWDARLRITRGGSAGAPTVLRAATPGSVVIDGALATPPLGWEWNGVVEVSGTSHVEVNGIEVMNSTFFGIYVENASDVTVRNCATRETYASGIYAGQGSSRVTIRDNLVRRACVHPGNGSGKAIDTQECITVASVDGFEVAGNVVYDRLSEIPGNNGGEGIDAKGSCRNGTIHGNTVFDLSRVGIYVDAYGKNASNIAVFNNEVINTQHGIAVANEVNAGLLSNVSVSNNLVHATARRGITIAGFVNNGPVQDVTVVHNTVVSCGSEGTSECAGIYVEADHPTNRGFVVRNNLLAYNHRQMRVDAPWATSVDTNLLRGATDFSGAHAITSDPQFLDAAGKDFRLGSGSPAIDRAISPSPHGQDFEGILRPQDGTLDGVAVADLGAFERPGLHRASGGLLGSYYGSSNQTGAVQMIRIEPVNFNWAGGPPHPGLPPEYSVSWVGEVRAATTGNHEFRTRADGRVRLWVEGQLVVDATSNGSSTQTSAARSLVAGQRYAVKMDYEPQTGSGPLYRETFPASHGTSLGSHGWAFHSGPNGVALAESNSDVAWSTSTPATPVGTTSVNAANAGEGVASPDQGFARFFSVGGARAIAFTSEFSFVVGGAGYDLREVSYIQAHGSPAIATRVAVRVGGQWFVSDQSFQPVLAIPNTSDFGAKPTPEGGNHSRLAVGAGTLWRRLAFTPGVTLGEPSASTEVLPSGTVTAFGIYSAAFVGLGGNTASSKLDTFAILATRRTSGAQPALEWKTPGSGSFAAIPGDVLFPTQGGLLASYFNNTGLSGSPVAVGVQDEVGFDWKSARPLPPVNADDFSARWAGKVRTPVSGNHEFRLSTNDGGRLRVNGALVINRWNNGAQSATATVFLNAGQETPIVIEQFEATNVASALLEWKRPGETEFVIVPKENLTPEKLGN